MSTRRFRLFLPLLLLATVAFPVDPRIQLPVFTKTVDPCTVTTPAQLQPIIKTALNSAFPIVSESPGKKITLSDPELVSLKCSNPLTVEIRAKIKTRDTRGLDQGQASGQMRFSAKIWGKVTFTGVPNGPVTKDNFKQAKACMSDFKVLELNLDNVPNWLDNTVVRDILNSKLSKSEYCFDITSYVMFYLQNGGTL